MTKNPERIERIQDQLRVAGLDAFVCTFAAHVVMVSGYWPVVGTSIAIATRDGTIALLVPKDEAHLTPTSWADTIETYTPTSLESEKSPAQFASDALKGMLGRLGLEQANFGYEHGPISEPASYASMHIFGASIRDVLLHASPKLRIHPADNHLEALDSVKTAVEVDRIRRSCDIAASAFERGRKSIEVGISETEVANIFRDGLSTPSLARATQRADGFVFCMSGQNSARAFGAFAQTGHREIANGDLVLVHCNSYADGYWTDITRTYTVGNTSKQEVKWRSAIQEARAAALDTIAPGVAAADVDRAGREVFAKHGLEKLFRHSIGHGVGFAAISANARPRLHPKSTDVLEEGMVFNLEPALYAEGFGGIRHCDMVVVSATGAEVLTPFQANADELHLPGSARAA